MFFTLSCTNQWCSSIFCIYATYNPQFFSSLWRRANTQNVSFWISFWWLIHIINPFGKTKLSCNTPHRHSTTVSLETYPFYSPFYRGRFPLSHWLTVVERFTCMSHRNFFTYRYSNWIYCLKNKPFEFTLVCQDNSLLTLKKVWFMENSNVFVNPCLWPGFSKELLYSHDGEQSNHFSKQCKWLLSEVYKCQAVLGKTLENNFHVKGNDRQRCSIEQKGDN